MKTHPYFPSKLPLPGVECHNITNNLQSFLPREIKSVLSVCTRKHPTQGYLVHSPGTISSSKSNQTRVKPQ